MEIGLLLLGRCWLTDAGAGKRQLKIKQRLPARTWSVTMTRTVP